MSNPNTTPIVYRLYDALDEVNASLETCMAHYGKSMPDADQEGRRQRIENARQVLELADHKGYSNAPGDRPCQAIRQAAIELARRAYGGSWFARDKISIDPDALVDVVTKEGSDDLDCCWVQATLRVDGEHVWVRALEIDDDETLQKHIDNEQALLAALRDCLRVLREDEGYTFGNNPVMDAAKAAIAKAEGKGPAEGRQ